MLGDTRMRLYMSTEDLKEIEISIEQAQEAIDIADAYQRLRENPDFKLLIEKHYMRDFAARLVLLRGDYNLSAEDRVENLKDIDAVGSFVSFLRTIVFNANRAKDAIAEAERLQQAILAENLEE